MSTRKVFGRIKNIECGEKWLYSFELIRYSVSTNGQHIQGGVRVRRRGSRKPFVVTFQRLAEGNATTREIDGKDVSFALGDDGLEVKLKGERGRRVLSYGQLANLGKRQPMLI